MKTKVADISQVDEGKALCVTAESTKLVLIKQNGAVFALENKCPHLGLPIGKGKIKDGNIVCPFHGSRFDIATGENRDWVNSFAGMSLPDWSKGIVAMGKKPAPVKSFKVEVDGADIFVEL